MKHMIDGTATKMMAVNPQMPPARAQRKAQNTIVGAVLLIMGALSFFMGMGLIVLPFFLMKQHPGTWLLAFGAVVVTFAFMLVTIGARAISDDAIDSNAAPRGIIAIGKAIGFARGKTLDG